MRKPDKVYVDEKREGKRYRVTEGKGHYVLLW